LPSSPHWEPTTTTLAMRNCPRETHKRLREETEEIPLNPHLNRIDPQLTG
jgi:hypothetical protein